MSLRRRLYFKELLKRRKTLSKTVVLPKKRFFPTKDVFRASPKLKKFLIMILLIALLIGAIYFFFFSEAIRVKEIVFLRGKEKVVFPEFTFPSEKFLGKHMFFIPTTEVRRDVLHQHEKELQSIAIKRRVPSKLLVRYDLFPPVANLVVLERKFLVNEHGMVISQDAEASNLPYITGVIEDFPKLKTLIVDPAHLKSMVRAYDLFTEKFGMEVPTVLYKKTEREVHLKTERGFWIWLDLTQNMERQLFKLKRALPKLNIYEESLEYIDLRVSGKTGEKVIFQRR